ncbi:MULTISPECIES: cytochrome C [unclassified Nitrospina]|uniref:cytochrome C n=1 Tax=unclassified Nitrospina TaxID=2638683 RepID=UPI003F9EAB8A
MLPEQHDILWSFLTMMCTIFALYVFNSVVQICRAKEEVNTTKWGVVFGVFLVVIFVMTVHMFTLVQRDQMFFFFFRQLPVVLLLLLIWGYFFKSEDIESQSEPLIRAGYFFAVVSILLAGYTNWLPQQRSDPPPKGGIELTGEMTMEEYTELGRVIVFGAKQVAGQKAIGKGQCPLCHSFDPGDHMGRCPNLFGVEERSHSRVKEDRYLNSPIKVGEKDQASGIIKGKPEEIPEEYRRSGPYELAGEDYLRESLMCPSCYVVEGFGKAGDTVSPMPIIHKPPISLSRIELNAVVAWMQAKDTPGDFAKVTVPLPSPEDNAAQEEESAGGDDEERPVFVTGNEPIEEIINTLGCPLCHKIPGIPGAVGELGPPLYEKVNTPKRLKDPNYKGKAKTAHEYTKESILNPSAYVVFNEEAGEPYPDGVMPQDFGQKLSVQALDKLVDFIANTEPEG